MKKQNLSIPKDAFGHVRLDEINPGQWFAKKLGTELEADKVLVAVGRKPDPGHAGGKRS